MAELLDRAFPFTVPFDSYAEKLYMEQGASVQSGVTAVNSYYSQLRILGCEPEVAFMNVINPPEGPTEEPNVLIVEPTHVSTHDNELGLPVPSLSFSLVVRVASYAVNRLLPR